VVAHREVLVRREVVQGRDRERAEGRAAEDRERAEFAVRRARLIERRQQQADERRRDHHAGAEPGEHGFDAGGDAAHDQHRQSTDRRARTAGEQAVAERFGERAAAHPFTGRGRPAGRARRAAGTAPS
jgi:hypothetical protein